MHAETMFRRILMVSSSGSMGAMLALLALIERSPGGNLVFRAHWAAIPLFLGGAVAGFTLWKAVFQFEGGDTMSRRSKLKWVGIFLGILAVASFGYPLRFVDPQKRSDVLTGLFFALLVLTFFGWMIWKAIQLVSSNEPKDGEVDP